MKRLRIKEIELNERLKKIEGLVVLGQFVIEKIKDIEKAWINQGKFPPQKSEKLRKKIEIGIVLKDTIIREYWELTYGREDFLYSLVENNKKEKLRPKELFRKVKNLLGEYKDFAHDYEIELTNLELKVIEGKAFLDDLYDLHMSKIEEIAEMLELKF